MKKTHKQVTSVSPDLKIFKEKTEVPEKSYDRIVKELNQNNQLIIVRNHSIHKLNKDISALESELIALESELIKIHTSKFWKITRFFRTRFFKK